MVFSYMQLILLTKVTWSVRGHVHYLTITVCVICVLFVLDLPKLKLKYYVYKDDLYFLNLRNHQKISWEIREYNWKNSVCHTRNKWGNCSSLYKGRVLKIIVGIKTDLVMSNGEMLPVLNIVRNGSLWSNVVFE